MKKDYINKIFKKIVNRRGRMILGGILFTFTLVSAEESDFSSNAGEDIQMEQRAYWLDEENYKGVAEVEFYGLTQWSNQKQTMENMPADGSFIQDKENDIDVFEVDSSELTDQATGNGQRQELCFSVYLSQYFMPDPAGGSLPFGVLTEEIPVISQLGTETMLTRLYYTFTEEDLKQDQVKFSIPVMLRKEYQYAEKENIFPVFRETNLFSGEELTKLITYGESAYLRARAGRQDFSMNLKSEKENLKAGEILYYHIFLNNTGERELQNIALQVQAKDYPVYWQQSQDLTVYDGNGQAVLGTLGEGESRELIFWLQTEEAEDGDMEIAAQAFTQDGSGPIKKEEVIHAVIQPLTADFTVEKTADCILAGPGETITYQICIRNTGERTLHSVLSTEKFLDSRIKARFLEMEGVKLNGSRTKALIPRILPGEAVGLKAIVVLPQDIENSALINQVIVTSNETGEKQIQAEAGVTVQGISPTVPEMQPDDQPSYASAHTVEREVPKTGDPMFKKEYEQLMLLAFGISIVAAIRMLHKKRKEGAKHSH